MLAFGNPRSFLTTTLIQATIFLVQGPLGFMTGNAANDFGAGSCLYYDGTFIRLATAAEIGDSWVGAYIAAAALGGGPTWASIWGFQPNSWFSPNDDGNVVRIFGMNPTGGATTAPRAAERLLHEWSLGARSLPSTLEQLLFATMAVLRQRCVFS